MTMVEKLALEAVAIGMFESFLRQQREAEGRGRSIRDWNDLQIDERNHWRDAAADMLQEMADR